MPTDPTAFLRAHGEAIVHNLGHDCLRASREICEQLHAQGALPDQATVNEVMQVILSMRATLELMAVEHRFGAEAHDALLDAMLAYYDRTLLRQGSFTTWIAAAHETMRRSENPRDWLRIHAEQLLGTHEPEDTIFHTALGYGLRVGPAVVDVVEQGSPGGPGQPNGLSSAEGP